MTQEMKSNLEDALLAEKSVLLIELTEDQSVVAEFLDIDMEDLQRVADAAFNSALKGKVAAVRDRAIKAKYIAEGKGKVALSEECEKEVQQAMKLYRLL